MRQSQLGSKYLKNRGFENKAKYKKKRIFVIKLYEKERKKFNSILELNQITDIKDFGKL